MYFLHYIITVVPNYKSSLRHNVFFTLYNYSRAYLQKYVTVYVLHYIGLIKLAYLQKYTTMYFLHYIGLIKLAYLQK